MRALNRKIVVFVSAFFSLELLELVDAVTKVRALGSLGRFSIPLNMKKLG